MSKQKTSCHEGFAEINVSVKLMVLKEHNDIVIVTETFEKHIKLLCEVALLAAAASRGLMYVHIKVTPDLCPTTGKVNIAFEQADYRTVTATRVCFR